MSDVLDEVEAAVTSLRGVLLHDIAHTPVLAARSAEPHDRIAQRWLLPRFGCRVARLAGAHVAAKRRLAATDTTYTAHLSQVSRLTLATQGGATSHDARTMQPWWPDALLLRRCDDAAKVPGAATLPVTALFAAMTRVADKHFGRTRR
jgi:predicted HD phosphohydrolase